MHIKPFSPPGWLFGEAPEIVHGDCTQAALRHKNGQQVPASYVYTSIPFRGVLDGTLGGHIVRAFDSMLLPRGFLSFVLIDSADRALRDGVVVNPAAATVEYIEHSGEFALLDRVAFEMKNAPPGCDDQFTELLFVRRSELESWRLTNPQPLSDKAGHNARPTPLTLLK